MLISACNLCHIISCWLDLLRPGIARQDSPESRITNLRNQLSLQNWLKNLLQILTNPISLWSAILDIVYHAAILRFTAILPIHDHNGLGQEHSNPLYTSAIQISTIRTAFQSQNLLDSLWPFGIHELDLAMG
jgi:hypothetical protein